MTKVICNDNQLIKAWRAHKMLDTRKFIADYSESMILLARANSISPVGKNFVDYKLNRQAVDAYYAGWVIKSLRELKVNGNDLTHLMEPTQIGVALNFLFESVITGKVKNDNTTLKIYLLKHFYV